MLDDHNASSSPPAPSQVDAKDRHGGRDDYAEPRRYFARPDAGEQPLTLRETLLIVVSTHLGVRTRAQRQEDFRRANGLHLFIAGVLYFALIVGLLIALVNWLST